MATDLTSITAGQNALAALPTPAQNLSNYLSNQQSMLANQQTMRAQQSQMGINNAIKANINPQTGQQDIAGTAMAIANDPTITVGAQDAVNNLYDGQIKKLNASGQQLDQAQTTNNYVAGKLSAVMAQAASEKRLVNQGDIAGVGADLINSKILQPEQVTALVGSMPTDPQGMHSWIVRNQFDASNKAASIARISGEPGTVQTGAGLQGITQSPLTGAITPSGGQVANQLSPQDLSQPVDIKDAVTGQPKTITRGALLQMQGVNPVPANGAAPFPAALQGPGAGSYRPPGSMPSAGGQPQPAQAPPGAPAPGAPSPFGGAVATAPAPIPFGLQGKAASASSDQFLADQKDAASYPQRANAANHVLDLLAALPSNATGPGTAGFTALKSGINSWMGSVGITPFDTTKITDTEQLHKYLEQQAESMPGAGHSADALASAQAANPNINMQTATIRDATASLLALQKMKQTLLTQYQQQYPSDKGGGGYQEWMSKKASEVDPRAWAVDTMTPAAKAALGKSLAGNPAAMAKFQASLAQADASGLLSSGGGQ